MIFENIPFKQKIAGLIGITLILFFAAKKRSFSVAYNMHKQVMEIEDKLHYIKNSTLGVEELKNEIAFYDHVIGAQDIIPEEIQQGILDYSATFDDISIIGIQEIHEAQSNGFNVVTNRLNIVGALNSQLNYIYDLEKNYPNTIISSINFFSTNDFSDRKKRLKSIITFQNYDKIKL